MQQQPKRSPIKRPLFLVMSRAIKDQLRMGVYNPKRLAQGFNVSAETIRTVRKAGTWPQWQRDKRERRLRAVANRRLASRHVTPPPAEPAKPRRFSWPWSRP